MASSSFRCRSEVGNVSATDGLGEGWTTLPVQRETPLSISYIQSGIHRQLPDIRVHTATQKVDAE